MPRLSYIIATLMLGTMLTGCGGGGANDTLLTPGGGGIGTGGDGDGGDAGEDSGIVTSEDIDQFTRTNEFIGFFIESPQYNPDDYSVGTIYLKTLYLDENMEEGYPFEGLTSYKFLPCQGNNLIKFLGFRDTDDSLDTYQSPAIIDGTSQQYRLSSILFDTSNYKGPYNFSGSDNISKTDCIDYTLAVRGKVELYPLNTTQFTDTLKDGTISFDASTPNKIIWNYDNFSDVAENFEHITIGIIDKTKLDSLNLFRPIYQAQANLAAVQALEEDNIAAAQAAVDTAQTNADSAQAAVTAAQANVATAQAKVDGLNALQAEATRLETIYNAINGDPAYTAAEIQSAYDAWQAALKAYNLENIFATQYQTALSQAQGQLSSAQSSLNSANAVLASREAALEAAEASVKAAEAALNAEITGYQPRLTDDVFLWQQTVPGSSTSFQLPENVTLLKDNYYLLNLVAWSSEGEKNYVYYHSSHVFRAD